MRLVDLDFDLDLYIAHSKKQMERQEKHPSLPHETYQNDNEKELKLNTINYHSISGSTVKAAAPEIDFTRRRRKIDGFNVDCGAVMQLRALRIPVCRPT